MTCSLECRRVFRRGGDPPSGRLGDNIAFEKIGPARPARPAYGLIALLKAVEAAIIGRGVVEGAPGPVGMGARSGAADQEQQCETADHLVHELLLLRPRAPLGTRHDPSPATRSSADYT